VSAYDKSIYRALSIVMFSVSLGFCIVNPFLPIYIKSIGANGLSIALIFSGYSLAKIAFPPFLGAWSDLRGRRVFLFAGLGIYAVVSLGYLFMPDRLLMLIVLRFAQGIGAALFMPLARATVGRIAPRHQEGTTLGTFEVSFYAALALGPVLGGFIKDHFGFLGIFGALFILCLLSLWIAVLTFSNFAEPGRLPSEPKIDYRRAVQSRTLQGLMFFILTRAFGIILFTIFLPIVMNNTLELSSFQIGTVMAFGPGLTALLLRPMGQLSDQYDRKFLVIIGGGMAALLTFFLPWAEGFWQFFMLSGGIGLFSSISLPASSALLIEEGSRYGVGLTVGFFNSVMEAGFLIAPFLGGVLMDAFGPSFVFYAAGLSGTLGMAIFLVLCPSAQAVKEVQLHIRGLS
jgi:MFS transporter, DHA1 family, multidrug resistance protein